MKVTVAEEKMIKFRNRASVFETNPNSPPSPTISSATEQEKTISLDLRSPTTPSFTGAAESRNKQSPGGEIRGLDNVRTYHWSRSKECPSEVIPPFV